MADTSSTVDPAEVARFSAMAESWWDPAGDFAPLHKLNPVRLAYIRDAVCARFGRDPQGPRPLERLRVLDVGCGGGLLCEPMARLGAQVTGIDASERNIGVARVHAEESGLAIDYRVTTAEAMAPSQARFDVVLAMEIVEHVSDLEAFVDACAALVAPGGVTVYSTLNRTLKSLALAKIGAEYVLRWLPAGTHDWRRFVRPSELAAGLRRNGMAVEDVTGVAFNPVNGKWTLSRDLDVNYMLTAAADGGAGAGGGSP